MRFQPVSLKYKEDVERSTFSYAQRHSNLTILKAWINKVETDIYCLLRMHYAMYSSHVTEFAEVLDFRIPAFWISNSRPL